jgi:hypothetical protein
MIYLVSHAAELAAPHVEGGLCPEHALVLKRINEAQRRLIQTDDPQYTLDIVNFFTTNNNIVLPRRYVSARLVTMCGYSVSINSIAHEFVSSGPGQYSWDRCAQLVDEGKSLTFFPIPTTGDWYLMAYSTSASDTTKTISFRGQTSSGSDILTSAGSPIQTLSISRWSGGTEGTMGSTPSAYFATPVRSLTGIQLPTGLQGYITLLAYDPTTSQMMFLAKYFPEETTPAYRKYRLPAYNSTDGLKVSCLCKKDFIPAVRQTDELLIQNPDAIKMMVMSIEAENSKDINGAVAMKQLAVNQMREQMSNESRGVRFTLNWVGDSQGPTENII